MNPLLKDSFHVRFFRKKYRVATFVVVLGLLFLGGVFALAITDQNIGLSAKPAALGVTFSKSRAESFGLDWRAVYTATLDDLGVRQLRIPVYWNDIERADGVYTFENIDWQLDEAEKRNVKIILAVGRKLPRWPECHTPEWAVSLSESEQQKEILSMLSVVVQRYASRKSVTLWQVENEPLFPYGVCPLADRDFLKKEIALVKSLDSRPVMITETGELSTWVSAASLADVLGVSTYRVVSHKYIGYFFWPVPPQYYSERVKAVSLLTDRVMISELQAEPWATGDLKESPLSEQAKTMNPKQLRDNVLFARRIGTDEIYLWGVEWWYWMKVQQGQSAMWETAKSVFAENK